MKPERTPEADGNERGLDELMLLAHYRHLSEEPEAQRGQPSAQPAQAAPAGPAKDDEVCCLFLMITWQLTSLDKNFAPQV